MCWIIRLLDKTLVWSVLRLILKEDVVRGLGGCSGRGETEKKRGLEGRTIGVLVYLSYYYSAVRIYLQYVGRVSVPIVIMYLSPLNGTPAGSLANVLTLYPSTHHLSLLSSQFGFRAGSNIMTYVFHRLIFNVTQYVYIPYCHPSVQMNIG